jgi:hypothetical protein
LENKDLIESLNQTKASSALIQDSLKESYKLQIFLDQVITSFYCDFMSDFKKKHSCVSIIENVEPHLQEKRLCQEKEAIQNHHSLGSESYYKKKSGCGAHEDRLLIIAPRWHSDI